MKAFLPFIITGLASGSVYGIAGMGLVLTYKTTGVFNFAHGAVATAAAYLFYELHQQHGLPWPVAVVLCVGALAIVGGLGMERVGRGLADASPAMKVVATVGLLVGIQGLAVAIYGPIARQFPPFLPTKSFELAGVNVGTDQMIVTAVSLAAAVVLYSFFRSSRLGVAMRAVVDEPDLLGLSGTNAPAVRGWAWAIGFGFAALSGVLVAPNIGLDAYLLTLLVVQAFGAAAIGGFSSLPLTYLGGLVVGVGGALATKYAGDVRVLNGFSGSLPFIVLFGFVLFTPARRLVEAARKPLRLLGVAAPPDTRRQLAGAAVVAVALLAVPQLVGAKLPVYTNAVIFVIVFVSLDLLVRTSGQISLCHAAFAAVGASTFSHLTTGAGLPWAVALLLTGLITVPIGALVAIPTIRLSGLYLALATFGYGVLIQRMFFGTGMMFGIRGLRRVPRPDFGPFDLAGDKGFYYVALAAMALAVLLVWSVHRSRLGRLLRAMADSPLALATHGTNVNATRVIVFCLSSFLAGIAGGLFGALHGSINGLGFGSFQSLLWLVILAISGTGQLRPALVAAAITTIIPGYFGDNRIITDYSAVVFGASAVVVALLSSGRYDLAGSARRAVERSRDRSRSPVRERAAGHVVRPTAAEAGS